MDWEKQAFWTAGATLYTTPLDPECHRLRLLVSEKQCPVTVEIIRDTVPAVLASANPENKYPFLTDKMLALYCPDSIEQFLNERFPDQEFLPADPKIRAQLRQISNQFRQWYLIDQKPWLKNCLRQLAGLLQSDPWIAGREMTIADIALLPWLWRIPATKIPIPNNVKFYMTRAFSRGPFVASLSPEEMGIGQVV